MSQGFPSLSTIQFLPLYQRPKSIQLNRVEFDFYSCDLEEKASPFARVELDTFDGESFFYSLKIQGERLLLESKNETPFILNGNECFKANIKKGDKVYMGSNLLVFEQDSSLPVELPLSEKIIRSNLPILLEGPTGVGKSSLAKIFHEHSGMSGDFIHLNLSAFSEGLFESELFGHKKGAFTGALFDKKGAAELAHNGTLFLDEIDSISSVLQTKILLFLDNLKFRAVGSEKEQQLKTRLIFAAGKNLKNLVQADLFRKDLFFRINAGVRLELMPIGQDKKRLQWYLGNFCRKLDITLEPSLQNLYLEYHWEGNLRELYGHLRKKKIITQGRKITFDHYDEQLLGVGELIDRPKAKRFSRLKDFEYHYIQKVRGELLGDEKKLCKVLDISKYRLSQILKKVD
jgi:transcriptional regulator with PAS, ATPase and Fis domain